MARIKTGGARLKVLMAEGGGGERAHVCFVSKSTNPGHGIPQQMALKQDCCLARRSQQHFVLAKGHDCTNLGVWGAAPALNSSGAGVALDLAPENAAAWLPKF